LICPYLLGVYEGFTSHDRSARGLLKESKDLALKIKKWIDVGAGRESNLQDLKVVGF